MYQRCNGAVLQSKNAYSYRLGGVEYDYVFAFETPQGRKLLGYNQGDNAYMKAEKFVSTLLL